LGGHGFSLGRDVFACGVFAGAEVLLSKVGATLVDGSQTAFEIELHVPGGLASALHFGHFFLQSLAVGEVVLPTALRVFLPFGKGRSHGGS
jgi:hypothetical protein